MCEERIYGKKEKKHSTMRFSIVFLNVFYVLFIFFTFIPKQNNILLCSFLYVYVSRVKWMCMLKKRNTWSVYHFTHCFALKSKQMRNICVCECTIKIIIIKTNKWEIILCFVGFVFWACNCAFDFTIFCCLFMLNCTIIN